MAKDTKHFLDEDDIGSGEKSPAQDEIQRDIEAIKAAQAGGIEDGSQLHTIIEEQQYAEQRHPDDETTSAAPERLIQSGTHIARATCRPLDDDTFEAQVFVRLTREPQIAETYIPAGVFATADQALAAAEERARRAIDQNEF